MQQNFFSHIAELRRRVLYVAGFIACGMGLALVFSSELLEFCTAPLSGFVSTALQGGLIFTHPMDKFIAHMQVGFFGGMVLVFPACLFHVWAFVAPGLYKNEKKTLLAFVGLGGVLFLLGVGFCYMLAFPMGLKFLMQFGGVEYQPFINLKEYLPFFIRIHLAFGVAFELPLAAGLLSFVGAIDDAWLKQQRSYAIVGLSVLAMFITPPDIFSMLFMLAPLLILYELSIVVARVCKSTVAKKE